MLRPVWPGNMKFSSLFKIVTQPKFNKDYYYYYFQFIGVARANKFNGEVGYFWPKDPTLAADEIPTVSKSKIIHLLFQ